jgi:citrate lyase beta subunit
MTKPALTAGDLAAVDAVLRSDDAERGQQYPGTLLVRQPIHTVYVPADQVHAGLSEEWGRRALRALHDHAPDAERLASATGVAAETVASIWDQLLAKLGTEPIEDLRVDLEDGYGSRGDDAEDADALAAGRAIADARDHGVLPPFCGLRFKSLEAGTRARGIRTLDLLIGAVLERGELPVGWVQTLPKVTSVRQVTAMVELCTRLEAGYGLAAGQLRFEIQVETPQAILANDGTATVAVMIRAAEGRCTGLHFGTYDYTASLGIAGGYQALDHPSADHAKAVMQVAAAVTAVRVSDGSTNVLPVGDQDAVHAAWALHTRLVGRALERGLYQGWDLHPAQLPTRFLATYLFFRRDLGSLAERLRQYLHRVEGGVLDEPATAQAMAAFLLRAVQCGAATADEVATLAGCQLAELIELAGRRMVRAPG